MNKKSTFLSRILLISLLLLAPLNISFVSQAALSHTIRVQSGGEVRYPAPPNGPQLWMGVSSYPRTLSGSYSTAIIDDVIETMDAEGLTIYRMSIWYTVDPNPWVQYYLDHCDYNLIVCRHMYPQGSLSPSQWIDVQTWTLELLSSFHTYQDRLWVEPINERVDSDLASRVQTIVTAVRTAGYTAKIIVNKWEQSWSSMASIYDPLDAFWTGYHFYFNSWSLSGARSQMQTALQLGLHVLNTEIGADYNEAGQFDQSEVEEVNAFMSWCAEQGIGNTVWMRYGLENLPRYQQLNLQFPI